MKQKVLSLGDDYVVQDEDGETRFVVDAKAFSVGNKLVLCDADGLEQVRIVQKVLAWGPTYEILRDGETVAVVKQQMLPVFHSRFAVSVPGADDLEASGDFWEHEYVLLRQDEEIARVSKQCSAWSDTYGIEIADGEDDVLIVALAVVIDLCCHGKSRP